MSLSGKNSPSPLEQKILCEALRTFPETARSQYLDAACGDDQNLRSRVDDLIKTHGEQITVPDLSLFPEDESYSESLQLPSEAGEFVMQIIEDLDYDDASPPEKLGRYIIEEIIGEGTFGTVYKGFDPNLNRMVAIKLIHRDRIALLESIDDWFEEARLLATLNHPGIVPVYDADQSGNEVFIVSEFIDGQSLATTLAATKPTPTEAVRILAEVAEAAHAAHLSGLVHRDIKPGNIMIRADGKALLIDFGLAISRQHPGNQFASGVAGTPSYMSPEQTRSEGHLVDRRSDIFSLGVVFFEMLVGQRPFKGSDIDFVFSQIQSHQTPKFPASDPPIPTELQRICNKCLAPRASERYQDGRELYDDLRSFLNPDEALAIRRDPDKRPVIVPKGLRSFDASDGDFFLQLLPGPYDREGFPECVRFWLNRIKATTIKDGAFRIGMIYGPSGSGKSSLIKAGVLPWLPESIEVFKVDASRTRTCDTLKSYLVSRIGESVADKELPEIVRHLRSNKGSNPSEKVLFVFDQFEQWLFGREQGEISGDELINTLRQCDGIHTQAILVIRDEFWIPASQLMEDLDCELRTEKNARYVEMFSLSHGTEILKKFGRSYGRIPADGEIGKVVDEFITESIRSLSVDGKIAPVQLALFAEMFKNRRWSVDELKRVGGAKGIGVAFFDENFMLRTSDPRFRNHRKAAKLVLESLLPQNRTLIKGSMKTEAELLAVSGYESQPQQFRELISILDTELKVITPVSAEDETVSQSANRGFQLTHDYLVPVIRDWLRRKKKETLQGRTELRMDELASSFNLSRERRHLPSFLEWIRFQILTSHSHWNSAQKQMMKAAIKRICLSASFLGGLILLLIPLGLFISNLRIEEELLDHLLSTPTADSRPILNRLESPNSITLTKAERIFGSSELNESANTNLALLLLPDRPDTIPIAYERLLVAAPEEFYLIIERVKTAKCEVKIVEKLHQPAGQISTAKSARFRALCALSQLDLSPPDQIRIQTLIDLLLGLSASEALAWAPALVPLSGKLEASLSEAFGHWDYGDPPTDQSYLAAAAALSQFYRSQPTKLLGLIDRARPDQLALLGPAISESHQELLPHLKELALTTHLPTIDADSYDQRARIQAKAIALLHIAGSEPEILSRAFQRQTHPVVLEHLKQILEPCGATLHSLTPLLGESNPPEVIRAALISISHYPYKKLSNDLRTTLEPDLIKLYQHNDAAIHSSALSVLTKWGWKTDELPRINRPLNSLSSWITTENGHTMVKMSPPARSGISEFYIASKETTTAQYTAFKARPEYPHQSDLPAVDMPISDIFEYCNWISDLENIPEEQWCYRFDEKLSEYVPKENLINRSGFRLPTSREWTFAAMDIPGIDQRSSWEMSAIHFCDAWHIKNSSARLHPVGQKRPNKSGLFDMFGNAREWTCDPTTPTNPKARYPYRIIGGHFESTLETARISGFDSSIETRFDTFRLVKTFKPPKINHLNTRTTH
ncbi:MAG: protein kinase [Verrucomicrobiales bacterium]|nr:protein kinase [Verrucomicrobiales bacterium]